MTSIRARKKASTREALLDAGKRLFAAQGFDKTAVDDIAEQATVSKFTFYSYFQSKEELLDELHFQGLASAMSVNEDAGNAGISVSQIVENQVSQIADWYEQNRDLARVLLTQKSLPFSCDTDADSCLTALAALIERGQQTGEFSNACSSKDIAKYMYLIAYGEKMSWIQADCSYSLKDKLIGSAKFLLKGLKPD